MPYNHLLDDLGLQLAGGEVVHEEHGRGALHGDVVDAVVHQVGADGVVQLHLKRQLQLGAYAVHAGDQHRVGILLLVDGKQPAKAANLAQHAAVEGLVGQILDALLGAIGALDVNTGVGVGDAAGLGSLLCQRLGPSRRCIAAELGRNALYHLRFGLKGKGSWDADRRRRLNKPIASFRPRVARFLACPPKNRPFLRHKTV